MELTTLSRWHEIEHSISLLGENVVVDCGHVPVRFAGQGFSFGLGGVSDSVLSTFVAGLALYRQLRAEGRNVKLNVCLSDTSRLLSRDRRRDLLTAIVQQNYTLCLPSDYLELLSPDDLLNLEVMLQTKNSNRFSSLIKKVKARIKRVRDHEALYNEFGGVFLKSHDGETFAFSTPFLMGRAGSEAAAHPEDLKAIEFIRENILISLYQKSIGPLCPATYGGLLLHYDESYDHICMYSRSDDAHITEKLLRGVISASVLKTDFSRKCLQIVFPEMSEVPELSLLTSSDMKANQTPFSEFIQYLESHKIFDIMSFYGM